MRQQAPRVLIVDACVLIDYCDADPSVLRVISRSVGEIRVASPVLAEVDGLDESAATALGLVVVEPSFAMFANAASKRGGLSVRDHLCLLLAKEEGLTCVSNDKALRNACKREGISVLWGLEMMGLAVEAGALPPSAATEIAHRIGEVNPTIGAALIKRFIERYAGTRKPGRPRGR
jgi:predicted nucleic acid-binding protein